MFVYTFQPIPSVDTVNDHTGLFFVGFVLLVTIILMIWNNLCENRMNRDWKTFGFVGIFAWLAFVLSAYISYNTGEILVYQNEPVTGKFVGFQTEGFNIREHHGKTTRDVDHHVQYVVYQLLPTNEHVLFPALVGASYPPYAILYANPAKE